MRIVYVVLVVMCLGCESRTEPKVTRMDYQPEIKYQVVELEGKKWIATPGSHGEWSLAGPLE